MSKKVKNIAMLLGAVFALWGCQSSESASTVLTPGKVVSIGKTHLILDDGKSVLFVTIEESDKENLKSLKKGDKVTLVSKRPDSTLTGNDRSVEVVEVITSDGVHIPLGG